MTERKLSEQRENILDGVRNLISQLRSEGQQARTEEEERQSYQQAEALAEAEWEAHHQERLAREQLEQERDARYFDLDDDEQEQAERLVDNAIDTIEIQRAARAQEELNREFNQAMHMLYNANGGRPTQSQKRDIKAVYAALGLKDFSARWVEE